MISERGFPGSSTEAHCHPPSPQGAGVGRASTRGHHPPASAGVRARTAPPRRPPGRGGMSSTVRSWRWARSPTGDTSPRTVQALCPSRCLATVTRPHHPPRTLPSGVGASSWVSRRVTGRWLLPLRDLGEGDHLCRSLAVQPFPIAFRTELRQGKPQGSCRWLASPPHCFGFRPSSRAIWICRSLR